MNWNQIESKWAAMARRVRADWKGAALDDAAQNLLEQEEISPDKKQGLRIAPDVKQMEVNAAATE